MSLFVVFLRFVYLLGLVFVVYSVVTSSFLAYIVCVCVLYICMNEIQKRTIGKISVQGQGIYITGCDTGKYYRLISLLMGMGNYSRQTMQYHVSALRNFNSK